MSVSLWRSNCPKLRKRSLQLQKQKTQGSVDKRNEKVGAISKKNPFKFTKKLFEGEKNGFLNIPKEDLEAHFRKKYTEPLTDTSLRRLNEPNRPYPPEEKFDDSPLKLSEIKDVIRKARPKSSPGINGISYKLYERCPKILALLWKLLREAYTKKSIAENWG